MTFKAPARLHPDTIFWLLIVRKVNYPKGSRNIRNDIASKGSKRVQVIFFSENNDVRNKYYHVNYYFHIKKLKLTHLQHVFQNYPHIRLTEEILTNPITKEKEQLVRVQFDEFNFDKIAVAKERINPKFIIDTERKPEQRALFDNNLEAGKPYRFVRGEPIAVETNIDSYLSAYETVLNEMDGSKRTYATSLIQMMHSKLPNFKNMVLAIDIEVLADFGDRINPLVAEVPVSSIGIVGANTKIVFTLSEKLLPVINPFEEPEQDYELKIFDSEYELLCAFMNYLNDRPEKFLSFYNGDEFDIPYLFVRMSYYDIKGIYMYFHEVFGNTIRWEGKYILDLYVFFKNPTIKSGAFGNAYDDNRLDTVADALIGEKKYAYAGKIADLSTRELAFYNIVDCELTFDILFAWDELPIFIMFFISKVSNLDLENSNRRGITKWWGGYMSKQMKTRGMYEPSYYMLEKADVDIKGGSVLEPILGMYRDVSVLDFSSLYPTNQINYNICPTTVNCRHHKCKENKLVIDPQGTEAHICTIHEGLMVEALDFFRNLRVKIFKIRTNKNHPEYSIFFKNMSQFLKIFMNACYGCLRNYHFAFQSLAGAKAITQTSRNKLDILVEEAIRLKCKVVYGDSVLGDTSIIIKDPRGYHLMSIERLWEYAKYYKLGVIRRTDKERMKIYNNKIQVWNTKEFVPMKAMVRHQVLKSTFEVASTWGVVIATRDHSLLTKDKQMITPQQIKSGEAIPHTAIYNPPEVHRTNDKFTTKISLFFITFSMIGTVNISSEKTKPDRPTYLRKRITMDVLPRAYETLLAIIKSVSLELKKIYNIKYKVNFYNSKGRQRYRFSFTRHDLNRASDYGDLYSDLIRHIYTDDLDEEAPKMKREIYQKIWKLNKHDKSKLYNFMKAYKLHVRFKEKNSGVLYFKSNTETTVFASLNRIYDEQRYIFRVSKKNKGYEAYPTLDDTIIEVREYKKVIKKLVYDIEADGTFMGSNYYLKNTDSVFVVGVKEGYDKLISERMNMDVENEGSWKVMLIHGKKNYLLINEDKFKVSGMSGKKRGTAKINRMCFSTILDNLKPSMTKNEMILFVMRERQKTIVKLDNLTNINYVTYSKTLNKKKCDCKLEDKTKCVDDEHYKTNTPLVKSALLLETELRKSMPSIKLFKKGTIIDYVQTIKGTMPTSMVKIEDVDINSYKKELDKILTQLLSPIHGKPTAPIDVVRFEQVRGIPNKHDLQSSAQARHNLNNKQYKNKR